MPLRVAQSLSQRLGHDMVYDLVHPGTGHFVRIQPTRDEDLNPAVQVTEQTADDPSADLVGYGTLTYPDRPQSLDIAMGLAKMYARMGFELCTEPAYERRRR